MDIQSHVVSNPKKIETVGDALKILGINRYYTSDWDRWQDIENQWQKLGREYHPDGHINEPNQELYAIKFKELSQAYYFLKRHYKDKDTVYIGATITKEMRRLLDLWAKESRMSLSAYIREVLAEHLINMDR